MSLTLFNSLSELEPEEVEELLKLSQRLEECAEPQALAGKVLALLFLSPSLRTMSSFQAAMLRLGGGSFVVSPNLSIHPIETNANVVMDSIAAEHIREALPVVASYGDAIGIRVFAPRISLEEDLKDIYFQEIAKLSPVPIINMESAIQHPCQSLADWKTMEDLSIPRKRGKFVLSWANHPKALPLAVAASTVQMAAMRGMEVTVLRPEGFELPEPILKVARELAVRSGGSVRETHDRSEALEGAHVLYAKSWSSTKYYGNEEGDHDLRSGLSDWCVNTDWFATADTNCRFMHCLPVRRGVVVTEEVLEGPRSVVVHEARNRMFAQMAVLYEILRENNT